MRWICDDYSANVLYSTQAGNPSSVRGESQRCSVWLNLSRDFPYDKRPSPMKIVIPDDYQNAVRHLDAFSSLAGHDVTIYNDTVTALDTLAARFQEADALVLIRERTTITAELLARLPNLKFISQTGRTVPHIDLAACTQRGIPVAAGTGSPYAPA